MKRKLSASILKITVILTVVVSLVLGVVFPVVAAPDETAPQADRMPPNVLRGKVVSIDEGKSSFVIESREGDEVTIAVDDNTKYFKVRAQHIAALAKRRGASGQIEAQGGELDDEKSGSLRARFMDRLPFLKGAKANQAPPGQAKRWLGEQEIENEEPMQEEGQELTANVLNRGRGKGIPKARPARLNWLRRLGEEAGFEDIAIGDRVEVRFAPGEDTLTAKLVIIMKAPVLQRVGGTIEAVSSDSITITTADGNSVTLSYDENTTFILKGVIALEPGQSVHAVYNSDDMVAKMVRMQPETAD